MKVKCARVQLAFFSRIKSILGGAEGQRKKIVRKEKHGLGENPELETEDLALGYSTEHL